MIARFIAFAVLCASVSGLHAQEAAFSTGPAKQINPGLIDCGEGSRVSAVGEIKANDGMMKIVPATVHFDTAPKATDPLPMPLTERKDLTRCVTRPNRRPRHGSGRHRQIISNDPRALVQTPLETVRPSGQTP